MKRFYLFATLVAVALTEAAARVVTTEPAIVQNDSRDIVVTFHADIGNDTSPKKVVWNYLDDRWHAGLRESYRELIWFRRHNAGLFGNRASADVSLSAWDTGRCVTLTDGDKQAVLLANPHVDKSECRCGDRGRCV